MPGYWTRSWLKKKDALQKSKVDFAAEGVLRSSLDTGASGTNTDGESEQGYAGGVD